MDYKSFLKEEECHGDCDHGSQVADHSYDGQGDVFASKRINWLRCSTLRCPEDKIAVVTFCDVAEHDPLEVFVHHEEQHGECPYWTHSEGHLGFELLLFVEK